MLLFQPERELTYSTMVTLFSQIDHYIQKPCAAAGRLGTGRWDEKVHYSSITLAQMISTFFFHVFYLFFFLQIVNH